jgi:molecular chaperone DnaK
MGRVIGIDLGTTNSVVAVMEDGWPVVIANEEGDRVTPSVVAYAHGEDRLVGKIAKRQAITNPAQTVHSIKRFMGRRFNEVEDERKLVPYKVMAGANGECVVDIRGQKLSPPEIASQVLIKLKHAAEDYLREPVTQAVITVPAYFNDAQRQATKIAGRIAGLEVMRLVNEPTAAAMAYGLDKRKKSERVVIFDFGGGTFDISILEISEDVVRVLATAGDTHLGGDDIDNRIVEWLLKEFKTETNLDVSRDKMVLQRLKEAAEKAKIDLSTAPKTEINLPFLASDNAEPKHLVREINRARLDSMIEDFITRTMTCTRQCLVDANLKAAEIDEVVLVGGSTRIPRVQDSVKKLFNKEPNKSVNPDEVVAIGAAVQAGVLSGEVKDLLLLDVTPLSLGVETVGGLMTRLIDRNSAIPIREPRMFTSTMDGQTSVEIHVLQGEREMARDNRSLGRFILEGIPPASRGVPRIEVTFDVDANGIVSVTAKDRAAGRETGIQVTQSTGLGKVDIEQLVKDAREHEEEDRRRRAEAETRNKAEHLIYQAERFLEERADQLGEWVDIIAPGIDELREAMFKTNNSAGVHLATEELQRNLNAAGDAIYMGAGLSGDDGYSGGPETLPPEGDGTNPEELPPVEEGKRELPEPEWP